MDSADRIFACTTYSTDGDGPSLDEIPELFWRRIDLRYPDGRVLAFVYTEDPGDEEMQAMMWKVQTAPPPAVFEIIVIDGEGTVMSAERVDLGFNPN